MRPAILVALTASLSAAFACGPAAERDATPPVADSATVATARNAANTLGPELMAMLLSELERGGPTAAMAVCADSAQVRTARINTADLHIRRVGTRVRNPLNAPDSLESRVLAYLGEELAAGRLPGEYTEVARTGADGGWELRFFRPVVLQEGCTACHGSDEQIPPAVKQVISERYRQDGAVDYRPGELRGAVTVRVRMPAAR